MTRKAKIIATLGNSTEELLEEIVANGADAVLVDTYYGSPEECVSRINKIKELREIRVETFMETTSTHDIALFVKVDNEETLKNYATNPLHVDVIKNYIKPFVYDRVCIDFFE